MKVDYSTTITPDEYVCGNCGATECKLWREYQTFHPALRCAICAAKAQEKNIDDIDAEGKYSTELGKIDQIGWYVPAVPDEEDLGYWGYTSVPQAGVNWWRRLPTLPQQQ